MEITIAVVSCDVLQVTTVVDGAVPATMRLLFAVNAWSAKIYKFLEMSAFPTMVYVKLLLQIAAMMLRVRVVQV